MNRIQQIAVKYMIITTSFLMKTGIDQFVFLQDVSLASMRFSQNTQRVVYPMGTADLLKNTTYDALCATTDNRVAIFDQKLKVFMEISLNGQDYHYVQNLGA